ncbi:MAG: hypothetical protein HY698_21555 [Deltaproteobacteria bacterium]|nr:hypothetical protein [Deltaproteobacteria bacterium]
MALMKQGFRKRVSHMKFFRSRFVVPSIFAAAVGCSAATEDTHDPALGSQDNQLIRLDSDYAETSDTTTSDESFPSYQAPYASVRVYNSNFANNDFVNTTNKNDAYVAVNWGGGAWPRVDLDGVAVLYYPTVAPSFTSHSFFLSQSDARISYLSEGKHYIRVVEAWNLVNELARQEFLVDKTRPKGYVRTGNHGAGIAWLYAYGEDNFTVRRVRFFLDGNEVHTIWGPQREFLDGSYQIRFYSSGTHYFYARIEDTAGNFYDTPGETFTVQANRPPVFIQYTDGFKGFVEYQCGVGSVYTPSNGFAYRFAADDPDWGAGVTYSLKTTDGSSVPANISIDPNTGNFRWDGKEWSGINWRYDRTRGAYATLNLQVVASDAHGGSTPLGIALELTMGPYPVCAPPQGEEEP